MGNSTRHPNVVQHAKHCGEKEKIIHQCKFCDKIFPFKSTLECHEHQKHKGDITVPLFVAHSEYSDNITPFISPSSDVDQEILVVSVISDEMLDADPDFSSNQVGSSTFIEVPGGNDSAQVHGSQSGNDDSSVSMFVNVSIQSEIADDPSSTPLLNNESIDDNDGNGRWADILSGIEKPNAEEADLIKCLLQYLGQLHEDNHQRFKMMIVDIFGLDRVSDNSFLFFLASKLDINYQNFKKSMKRWMDSGMEEKQGKTKSHDLSLQDIQDIYDMWCENAQPSTDNRNNRCQVRMSKAEYLKKYSGIENNNIEVQEVFNKRGRKNVLINRMIFTSTVRGIQKKLADKGLNVSIGSIMKFKTFFITYATEKEMALCLCKICINVKFFLNH